jgi:putative selenium metabolism protein SsnA
MMIDAIKHGTTTLIDHHASPNAIEGSLDIISDAVDKSGLRSVLCYEVTDRDGQEKARAGIVENMRFINRTRAGQVAGGRVAATFGLHASLTLSDETLETCRQVASEDIGFHIHVAEHEVDEYDSLAKSGTRAVDRLHRFGILGKRTIVAHAIHIDARELDLLAETGTWVSHQPRSNMNNGVGAAEVESMLQAGIPVCMGTDGFLHTMWEEWKTAYLLHKVWHRDPRRFSGIDAVRLGVYNNAALANTFFPQAPLGRITVGAFADLIFVDYHAHTPLTVDNLPWQIIFGFHESMVTTTIVDGHVLMQERRLLTMNEEAITADARQRAPHIWERYRNFVP